MLSLDSGKRLAHRVKARHSEIGNGYMSEIINLRRARKERQRRERDAEAAANRRRFGRTKEQKVLDRDDRQREHRAVDEKRLDPKDD